MFPCVLGYTSTLHVLQRWGIKAPEVTPTHNFLTVLSALLFLQLRKGGAEIVNPSDPSPNPFKQAHWVTMDNMHQQGIFS